MRLTERSMLRIAEDLRADDLADPIDDHGDGAVDHHRWVRERDSSSTTRLERVRFHVGWAGRFWRIRSLGSRP